MSANQKTAAPAPPSSSNNETAPEEAGTQNTNSVNAAQPAVPPPRPQQTVMIYHVGELRLIGILDHLGRGMGFYVDNSCNERMVRNVCSESTIAVRAFVFQGQRSAATEMARRLPQRYPNERFRIMGLDFPFRFANSALRRTRLPLGFRRWFLGLRPTGTFRHKLATDAECPPRLVRQYDKIWDEWKKMNGAHPERICDVAFIAWPLLPYCENGLSFEFIQELEADSLAGTEVVM
ncbi:hypothetical protein FBEOM_4607 [Fusarium beomiforme]|uniref:Uncharacterized protein n=1 Tax=Fusarium beomiforme TaxID=44412 RepID=A0A9P5AMR7_9HYPO|nr:hypothetical protein FBEOM_4607 [Fusarium beomiforme]